MKLTVRPATPLDDLAQCWPHLNAMGLNREQVLVAVDEDGQVRGGVIAFDGGHAMLYVGELTVLGAESRPRIAKALVAELLAWAHERGKRALCFHSIDPLWQSFMLRSGAKVLEVAPFFTIRLEPHTNV